MPSQPQRGNELWIVDRKNAALTVVDAAGCTVSRQMSVSTGFKANPHDVVRVSASKAYVTRYNKNLVVATSELARGDDLLIFDPQSGALLGRIDLGSFAAPDGDMVTQARPDRAVIAAGKVFVTLGSQDDQFVATGEGRLLLIDPATDRVTASLPLEGLKNCSAMTVSPDGQTLYVTCGGAFGSPDQRLQSGVAVVDLTASPPVVTRVVSSQVIGAQPLNFFWVAALSPTQVFAATFGVFGDPTMNIADVPDAAYAFDPTTGRSTQLRMAGPFDLGIAAAGPGRLFLPDATASAPRIRVLDVSGATPAEASAFDPEPAHGLPPREIAWY
jgi:DNA-binding beta-propeller fold protein YncE